MVASRDKHSSAPSATAGRTASAQRCAMGRANPARGAEFPDLGRPMPRGFIRAWADQGAAAEVNAGSACCRSRAPPPPQAPWTCRRRLRCAFPDRRVPNRVSTSSNMNANEVIARIASQGKLKIHPNDDVNLGQSSNDVIPTAIRVAAQLAVVEDLLPALRHLRRTIDQRGRSLARVTKTGRTHLMDAMPLTFAQNSAPGRRSWHRRRHASRTRSSVCAGCRSAALPSVPGSMPIRVSASAWRERCRCLRRPVSCRPTTSSKAWRRRTMRSNSPVNSTRWRCADQDRQRSALDEFRSVGRLGEIDCRPCNRAVRSCRASQPGDSGSVVHGLRAGLGHHVTISFAGASGSFQLNVMCR